MNPIPDNSYIGGFKALDFAPATRIAYNVSPWALQSRSTPISAPLNHFFSESDDHIRYSGY